MNMKKQYVKPLVAVEHYELSQAIAGCVIRIGHSGTNTCIKTDPDTPEAMRTFAIIGGFADATCLPTPDRQAYPGQMFDGICYHTQASAAFPS